MGHLPRSLTLGLAAGTILAVLVALFLANPIARLRKPEGSRARLVEQSGASFPEGGLGIEARRTGESDSLREELESDLRFDRSEVEAGRLPLWNSWNGGGRPHLARVETAVLSPFSIPYYVLGFRTAFLLSAFLELAALGIFTFLFLRRLDLSFSPAILGAAAFAFSGSIVLRVPSPGVGSLLTLPAGLYFAEIALRRLRSVVVREAGEQRTRARVRGPLAGLTVALAIGWLSGGAGSFLFSLLFVWLWILAGLTSLEAVLRTRAESSRPLAVFAGKTALACALATGFAAIQLLPFCEYAVRAELAKAAERLPGFSPIHLWPLAFFPAALGESIAGAAPDVTALAGAAESAHLLHVGGTVLFLALLATSFLRNDRRIVFFLVAALAWIVISTGNLVFAFHRGGLRILGDAALQFGPGAWAFSAACASSLAVDRLIRREATPAWGKAIVTAVAGLAFLAMFRYGLQASVYAPSRFVPDGGIALHLQTTAELFAGGIVALALLWVARSAKLRELAAGTLVLVVFLQTGWLFKDSDTVCPNPRFEPVPRAIEELRAIVGSDRVVLLGEDGLPPEANSAYQIALLRNGDDLGSGEFQQLFRACWPGGMARGPLSEVSERGLELFGIRWILARRRSGNLEARPEAFRLVKRIGEFDLYRYERSLGKYWFVRDSVSAAGAERELEFLHAESFDPRRTVVLGPDEEAPLPEEARREETPVRVAAVEQRYVPSLGDASATTDVRPRVVEETPSWIRLEMDCSAPGLLVVAQARYPGWKAYVNRIERSMYRANHAFSAIELQPGWNVVELAYEPESLRVGIWVALASGLFGLLCLFQRPHA